MDCRIHSAHKKNTLEKFQKIQLKKGVGCFIRHGPDTQIIPLAKYLDLELRKGKLVNEMNLSTEALDSMSEQANSHGQEAHHPGTNVELDNVVPPKTSKKAKIRRALDDDCYNYQEEDYLLAQMVAQEIQNEDNTALEFHLAPEPEMQICEKCLHFANDYKQKKVRNKSYYLTHIFQWR